MQIAQSIAEFNAHRNALKGRVALVPTMGNLHDGHLMLVKKARRLADRVIVTIFVNPLQFGANEDLSSYPRTIEEDLAKLDELGVDVAFTPTEKVIYPSGIDRHTRVSVPELTDMHCGASRKGHFTGVSTVVTKLLMLSRPDIAVFGKKDYQQLAIIRKMVRDLALPVELVGIETVREPSGLAMSSRNGYLSDEQKMLAAELYVTLAWAKEQALFRQLPNPDIEQQAIKYLTDAGFEMEYFSICNQYDLGPAAPNDDQLVILAAGKLGTTRLIDNVECNIRRDYA